MIQRNVKLLPARKLSSWRKISLGTWRPNGDSQVYCELKLDATQVLEYIKQKNTESDRKITMTHVVGKMLGNVLREIPDLNSIVRFSNIYQRQDVDIFFHVTYDDTELSGHVIRSIDKKSTLDIANELSGNAKTIRDGNDLNFKKIKNSWNFIPAFMARFVLDGIGFLSYALNLNIKGLGIPKDCFGSIMLTNIGSLGFSQAFVPISPYSYIPLVVALGKTEMRPYVKDDNTLGVRPEVSLCFTFDHRIMDGARGAKMSKLMTMYMAEPNLLDN